MSCVGKVIPFLASSRGFTSSEMISEWKKGLLSERHRVNWSRVL